MSEHATESSINSSIGINTQAWGKYGKRAFTSANTSLVCITD